MTFNHQYVEALQADYEGRIAAKDEEITKLKADLEAAKAENTRLAEEATSPARNRRAEDRA